MKPNLNPAEEQQEIRQLFGHYATYDYRRHRVTACQEELIPRDIATLQSKLENTSILYDNEVLIETDPDRLSSVLGRNPSKRIELVVLSRENSTRPQPNDFRVERLHLSRLHQSRTASTGTPSYRAEVDYQSVQSPEQRHRHNVVLLPEESIETRNWDANNRSLRLYQVIRRQEKH